MPDLVGNPKDRFSDVTAHLIQDFHLCMIIWFSNIIQYVCSLLVAVAMACPKSDQPGPEVIKLFSSSAQLSMKFQLLINVKIFKKCGKFRFKTQKLVIYPAHKC